MSFSAFIRDTAYFQIRRDQQMIANAEDFNLQFNNIVNYINTKIQPIVNNLQGNTIAGTNEPGTANTFLRNIGDGSTEWAAINNAAVNDYSIAFSKLVQAAPGSMFATAADRIFRIVTPTLDGQTLIARNNNAPIWKKLQGENFFDRSLGSTKINFAAIGLEHLSPQIIGRPVANNAVLERHILNQTITSNQIANGALVASKIKQEILDTRKNNFNIGVRLFTPANAIENRHVANDVLDFYCFSTNDNLDLLPKITNNINEYTFTSEMIEDNTFTAEIVAAQGAVFSTRIIMNGAVEPRHIIANSLTAFAFYPSITGVRIKKEKLSVAIRIKLGI